ncbi:hypothetical protein, partial [Roseburia faecis]|uniref:hypothetical protein n=1 Tax=Roseburia faecis TaxID=301302 RepID=UPI0019212427
RHLPELAFLILGTYFTAPFLLNDMTEENRKLKLITFPGETVVIDEHGKRIVACPTEDEAEEYIGEQEE